MKGAILVVGVLALVARLSAQTRPDFTGTWEQDVVESRGFQGDRLPPQTLTVRQTDTQLTWQWSRSRDGGGAFAGDLVVINLAGITVRETGGGVRSRTSVAWKGGRLVVTDTAESKRDGRQWTPFHATVTTWTLSTDLKTLTQETKEADGPVLVKRIYRRAAEAK